MILSENKYDVQYIDPSDHSHRGAFVVVLEQYAIGQAKLEQIMLPFAVTSDGQTYYQRLVERGSLALPEPRHEPEMPRVVIPEVVEPKEGA